MAHYDVKIQIDSDKPRSMGDVLDTLTDALERDLRLTVEEYDAVVHGPPELTIGAVYK